jgi:ADP-heptose:LPS heptosyltransferase
MSPRQALQGLDDALRGSEFERAMRRARRLDRPAFLFGWNRGLGDVALGLTPYFQRIRAVHPQARIVAITRPDLAEVFELARTDEIHVVEGLKRGHRLDVRAEARRRALDLADYAGVHGNPDLRRWHRRVTDEIPPRLHWQHRYDLLAERFPALGGGARWVGVHVNSESAQFYRYTKDWPNERWAELFARVRAEAPAQFVLFGTRAHDVSLHGPGVLDLRGQTSLLDVLAIVRTQCRALVAPDSGILSASYLLDAQFELDVISLWADPRQGILKHGRPSPNRQLRHIPIVGRREDVGTITVDEVAETLVRCLAPSKLAA